MRKRTKAREIVLQILYQIDIGEDRYTDAWKKFWAEGNNLEFEDEIVDGYHKVISSEIKEFSAELASGIVNNLELLNKIINEYAENWKLSRIAIVERNILRLAVYELLFCPQIPPAVSINEAVDLAKKYSTLEAGKFVNGVLDKIRKAKLQVSPKEKLTKMSNLQIVG
ncbi:MAG: transcription antitermination factor NusB [Candidatus Omnitrophica bacterium]|nr:transcription antitermination factor NusB [Candidatus Omnitrophota bacterium]